MLWMGCSFEGYQERGKGTYSINRSFYRIRSEMTFRNELLTPSNPTVSINSSLFEKSIFFYIIPAYFIRAFYATS